MTVKELISENKKRNAKLYSHFNPTTGEGAVGERFILKLSDYYIPIQHLPITLKDNELIKGLKKAGSINAFQNSMVAKGEALEENIEEDRDKIVQILVKLRSYHDFCYWAITFAYIKNKRGGEDIPFLLNSPQRKLVEELEGLRLSSKPIRIILLKARQWGGSTLIQIYMAWIQLTQRKGWNSLVVSHVMQSTAEVKGMFSKLMDRYPLWMLHDDDNYSAKEKKLVPFEGSQSIEYIPQRNSKIKTGTAESPESARGGDTAMVHCTEVAFWKKTDNKTPEQIIRSACSGVLYEPYTIEIYETTANGTGNFFYNEWSRAKKGESDKKPIFISWFSIENYSMLIDDAFAQNLLLHKDDEENASNGRYNWWLWEQGATLEGINWYEHKRKGYDDHADMCAEYPSDDIEAFKHSGQKVFNIYKLEKLRKSCKAPKFIGEVRGSSDKGRDSLKNLSFNETPKGALKVWDLPEPTKILYRYLVVVDVGGRSQGSDYSVIWVVDRYWLMYGDKTCTVAQWCGHIRHDLLAWKSAQIAKFYNDALLVIESNTLETQDKERDTDGDHTSTIFTEISEEYNNLYARDGPADSIIDGAPKKWGFHTNRSTKPALIDNLITVTEELSYVERDEDTINEFATYEKRPNGSFGAISGKHDDKLMTRGIGLLVSNSMPIPKEITYKPMSKLKLTGSHATI